MAERRKRRRFTPEFKTQAVRHLLEGGKGLAEVATELGISGGQLSTWRRARLKPWRSARPRRRSCSGSSARTSGWKRRT